MKKIDSRDRQILFHMDNNSRITAAEIARNTGMSQQMVSYRIKTLYNQNVVFNGSVAVDIDSLGWIRYKLFLKFHSADEDTIGTIIDYLVDEPLTTWVVRTDGPYGVAIVIRVRQISELSDFLDRFSARYGQYVSDRTLSVVVSAKGLSRDYLVKGKGRKEKKVKSGADNYQLDDINRYILSYLGENSRISAKEIAERLATDDKMSLPISSEAILKRIKKLENDNIIRGYNLNVYPEALGMMLYVVLLRVDYSAQDKIDKFFSDCYACDSVVYSVKSVGEWDIELNFEVPFCC